MNFLELFLIAIGLSMDAFAVAVCTGLTIKRASLQKMLVVGLYFGFFQGFMPLVGYTVANLFAEQIMQFDHWVAFLLLSVLGGKMLIGSFQKENHTDENPSNQPHPQVAGQNTEQSPLKPAKMLPLAIATSIDAMAVGVSFAFLHVRIVPAGLLIGVTTLLLSMLGVKLGNLFGLRFKSKAELAGGFILILMGTKILITHLF